MFLAPVLRYALLLLVPLSVLLSTYLYLYPVFHLCAFPSPGQDASSAFRNTLQRHLPLTASAANNDTKESVAIAPFRLLALGDPQLEGESSIPDPEAATFPHLSKFWEDVSSSEHSPLQRLRHSLHALIDFYLDDIPKTLNLYRMRLDHVGNDYYLGHIYRAMHWWTDPSHVTVLGDLVGSQWIDDEEFEARGRRYWHRVFKGGKRISDEVASLPSEEFESTGTLGEDPEAWKQTILNVAGNHDIGYAGDLSLERMERFVRVFGRANYELRFKLPVTLSPEDERPVPELRIVVLNDMNLDTPASSKEMQDQTYGFLNDIITTSRDVAQPAHFTIVLTHIPIYKDAGICVDGPFFDFFDGHFENGVKEQNHLSRSASKGFLEGIFGMSGSPDVPGNGFGRHGLILAGHDHEGCDTYHYINQSAPPEREWQAMRWQDAVAALVEEEPGVPGLREITVRSMMGSFDGNAGLLSLWFDEEDWDWKYEFTTCKLGKQHIWWVVHILDLVTVGVALVYGILVAADKMAAQESKKHMGNGKAATPKPASKLGNGHLQLELAGNSKMNQKLEAPEAGTRSLRKKKSRRNLNGTLNGSPSSGSRI